MYAVEERESSFVLLLLSVGQQEMSLKVLFEVSCISSACQRAVHYIYLNARCPSSETSVKGECIYQSTKQLA
jgi:hypothetical protein